MFAVTIEFLDERDVDPFDGRTYSDQFIPCLPAKGDWVWLPEADVIRTGDQWCAGGYYDDASFRMQDTGTACAVTLFVIMHWEQPAPDEPGESEQA